MRSPSRVLLHFPTRSTLDFICTGSFPPIAKKFIPSGSCGFLGTLRTHRISDWSLDRQLPKNFASTAVQVQVDREVCVEHGHPDQTGRLDVVFRQGTTKLAIVEVKTRPFSESDLDKHEGYRLSVSPETELIFLAVNPPDSDPHPFRFLSWADVCQSLRRIGPRLLAPEHILGTSLMLAFIGAVEQNLLGLESPDSISVSKIPQLVEHLTKALEKT